MTKKHWNKNHGIQSANTVAKSLLPVFLLDVKNYCEKAEGLIPKCNVSEHNRSTYDCFALFPHQLTFKLYP